MPRIEKYNEHLNVINEAVVGILGVSAGSTYVIDKAAHHVNENVKVMAEQYGS